MNSFESGMNWGEKHPTPEQNGEDALDRIKNAPSIAEIIRILEAHYSDDQATQTEVNRTRFLFPGNTGQGQRISDTLHNHGNCLLLLLRVKLGKKLKRQTCKSIQFRHK